MGTQPDDDGTPATGAPVLTGTPLIVLSIHGGRPYPATVQTWVATAQGLVVSARVSVTAEAMHSLADHRVWVSVPDRGPGFTVFSGVAHRAEETALDITGVVTLVRERRREHVRGPAKVQVSISTGDASPRQLQVVDLSQGGVRVALRAPSDLALDEFVTVEVHLEDGASISARGKVIRIDSAAGQAVVRFEDLSSEHGTRIDRYVLLHLTPDDSGS